MANRQTSFWAWFRPLGPKFGMSIFFWKTWFRQSLDIMVSYHHIFRKKLKRKSWENLVTDGLTDGKSDFIGRCSTNVERSIMTKLTCAEFFLQNWRIFNVLRKPCFQRHYKENFGLKKVEQCFHILNQWNCAFHYFTRVWTKKCQLHNSNHS